MSAVKPATIAAVVIFAATALLAAWFIALSGPSPTDRVAAAADDFNMVCAAEASRADHGESTVTYRIRESASGDCIVVMLLALDEFGIPESARERINRSRPLDGELEAVSSDGDWRVWWSANVRDPVLVLTVEAVG